MVLAIRHPAMGEEAGEADLGPVTPCGSLKMHENHVISTLISEDSKLISRSPLREEQEFILSRDVEISSRNTCVERKDRKVEARHKLLFPSHLETTFSSCITTLQRHQTNQTAITGRGSTAVHCSTLLSSHIP